MWVRVFAAFWLLYQGVGLAVVVHVLKRIGRGEPGERQRSDCAYWSFERPHPGAEEKGHEEHFAHKIEYQSIIIVINLAISIY